MVVLSKRLQLRMNVADHLNRAWTVAITPYPNAAVGVGHSGQKVDNAGLKGNKVVTFALCPYSDMAD
jgi:hypothetical protein